MVHSLSICSQSKGQSSGTLQLFRIFRTPNWDAVSSLDVWEHVSGVHPHAEACSRLSRCVTSYTPVGNSMCCSTQSAVRRQANSAQAAQRRAAFAALVSGSAHRAVAEPPCFQLSTFQAHPCWLHPTRPCRLPPFACVPQVMELGIGPTVTAGLIIQLLVGSKLLDVDTNVKSDRDLM